MLVKAAGGARGRARSGVLRYAEQRGWNASGLPDHGAALEVLGRIIALVGRHGMHLGRWRDGFSAVYGVFVGEVRPRSYSRHGYWWMHTRGTGGIAAGATACRDLLAYEERLGNVTDAAWDATRKDAWKVARPKR